MERRNKHNTSYCRNNSLFNCARNTAEAIETMLQVNNTTVEEQVQQIANLTI